MSCSQEGNLHQLPVLMLVLHSRGHFLHALDGLALVGGQGRLLLQLQLFLPDSLLGVQYLGPDVAVSLVVFRP